MVPRRGHPTWTCLQLLCACPAAPAVPLSPQHSRHRFHFSSPCRPRPLTLSISLFFSSPFDSFSCWLSIFQASRPRRLCTLLSAPDFHRLPAGPLHPPWMLGTTWHHCDGGRRDRHGARRCSAASCCSPRPPLSLLGCWALQPKIPSLPPQTLNATEAPTAGGGTFGFVVPLPSLGMHGPGSAQGVQQGLGLLTQPETARGASPLPPVCCLWAFFLPSPPLPPLHPNKPLEKPLRKTQAGSVIHSRSPCCHPGSCQ